MRILKQCLARFTIINFIWCKDKTMESPTIIRIMSDSLQDFNYRQRILYYLLSSRYLFSTLSSATTAGLSIWQQQDLSVTVSIDQIRVFLPIDRYLALCILLYFLVSMFDISLFISFCLYSCRSWFSLISECSLLFFFFLILLVN